MYILEMSPFERIIVIGTTGTGKSTLAQQLAEKFDGDFVELDALYWEPGWQPAPFDVFYARVEAATQPTRWAAAGNYQAMRGLVWDRADTIIWLDYPFLFNLARLSKRAWHRWWSHETLWNGNRESIGMDLKLWSQESLFYWFFKNFWKRKREYTLLLALPEYASKALRFTSQQELDAWLEKLDM